jgi:hypothetical protein
MPAVKRLYQSSQDNAKAPYIFGHSFQALGLLAQSALGQLCCVPLISRIHEGLVFSNRDGCGSFGTTPYDQKSVA